MKKNDIVKKAKDFDLIIQKGKKIKNKFFNIFYINIEDDKKLFGIAVSKKNGNAVVRNKMKRQIRNIIDSNKNNFKNNCKYIIMIKSEGIDLSYTDKEMNLIKLVKEMK